MRRRRVAGLSFTMLVALFLVTSAGINVDQVGEAAASAQAAARSPTAGPAAAPDGPPAATTRSYQRLTPTAKRLYTTVWRRFGIRSIGGWRAVGSVESSDHPRGRAIDVMIAYPGLAGRAQGWQVAKWAVANAGRLDVRYVIFHGRIWTRSRGWHGYRHPADPCNCNPTLRHDDHVHISVRH